MIYTRQTRYIQDKGYILKFTYKAINAKKKTKFYIKDFFSKCDQIRRKLRIWSHLLKKSLMENFVFCAVNHPADRSQMPQLNVARLDTR